MKALKSKLASQLLADPAASAQLRDFLVSRKSSDPAQRQESSAHFVVRGANGVLNVRATFVPKAAKAS